jgi:hypothetical protein
VPGVVARALAKASESFLLASVSMAMAFDEVSGKLAAASESDSKVIFMGHEIVKLL